MKKGLLTLAIASLVFVTAACSNVAAEEKGNKVEVTQAEIDYEFSLVPEEYKAYYKEDELKKEIEAKLLEQKVLKAEAIALSYDQEEKYQIELEKTKSNLLASRLIEDKIMNAVEVTDEDIKKFYDENIDKFMQGERVKARHILINTRDISEEDKAKAKVKAEEVLKRALSGEDFATLAVETSEGPTGPQGGDLGWFEKGRMVKPFEDAAFAGEVGKVYGELVETMFGYHIIFVEGKEETQVVPFEEVKDQLSEQVLNQKRYDAYLEYVEELKVKYGVAEEEKVEEETK